MNITISSEAWIF